MYLRKKKKTMRMCGPWPYHCSPQDVSIVWRYRGMCSPQNVPCHSPMFIGILVRTSLVGGLEHEFYLEDFLFSIIYGIILPIDFHIFQRGRYTTNQINIVALIVIFVAYFPMVVVSRCSPNPRIASNQEWMERCFGATLSQGATKSFGCARKKWGYPIAAIAGWFIYVYFMENLKIEWMIRG